MRDLMIVQMNDLHGYLEPHCEWFWIERAVATDINQPLMKGAVLSSESAGPVGLPDLLYRLAC